MSRLEMPDRRAGTPHRVPVLILTGAGTAAVTATLIAAWQISVPAATLCALEGFGGGMIMTRERMLRTDAVHSLRNRPLLLVGIYGGEALALRLALEDPDLICRGALICGDLDDLLAVPPLRSASRSPPLRFVSETADPLSSATTMGEWLSAYRADGIDAQGLVLPEIDFKHPYSASTLRAGLAYLSELVACELGSR